MWTLIWGTRLRRTLTSIFSLIAASCGAIVAVPPAWSGLGLPEVASKVFVHQVVDPVRLAQADTTKAVYLLTLQQLQSSLYAAEQDKAKSPSHTVDERIDELTQQIQQTQAKLNAAAH